MNGAESLVRTLVHNKVDVCFTNPGTSEMHFVAALDKVPGIKCVLGLFEGVLTGAADGYYRIAEKPASTLLHLGALPIPSPVLGFITLILLSVDGEINLPSIKILFDNLFAFLFAFSKLLKKSLIITNHLLLF